MAYCWRHFNSLKVKAPTNGIQYLRKWRLIAREYSESEASILPGKADAVICGGGVVGNSVAYHLAKKGLKDVILIEQGRLACGTSWHAAGLIGRLKQGPLFSLSRYSHQLYKWMDENGYPTSFKQCGRLDVARTPDMMTTLRIIGDDCRSKGLIVEELLPAEVQKISPWVEISDLQGGIFVPEDATTSPTDVCVSLAKLAKENGAKIVEGCTVKKVNTRDGSVTSVETSHGIIDCQRFILCGGMWSRELAAQTVPRVNLPLQPSQHFYLITKPINGVDLMHPVIRDRDASLYAREWSGGFLVGVFERDALPIFDRGPPAKFEFQLLPENWEHFQPYFEPIKRRLPFLETAEIRQMTNGPESFTPDCNPLLGEVPEVEGFYVATAMNSSGIMLAGGVGHTMAELIVDGKTSIDIASFDVKRFLPHHSNAKFLRARGKEAVGRHYSIAYPKQTYFSTGRHQWASSLYPLHKEAGAIFGTVNGLEMPLCFNKDRHESGEFTGTYSKPAWFEVVNKEWRACKEQSTFCDVTGWLGACELYVKESLRTKIDELFYTSTNIPIGKLVDTRMLDNQGKTVTQCLLLRKCQNRYSMLYPLATQSYVKRWISSILKEDVDLFTETTTSWIFVTLPGAKTKLLMEKLEVEMPQTGSFVESCLGYASQVLLLECPWLPSGNVTCCIPNQYAHSTYNLLREESARPIGWHTLDLLRIEEGIPWWGHEITRNSKPGKTDQGHSFVGKSPLTENVTPAILHFVIKNCSSTVGVWPWGEEIVFAGSEAVGSVTSVAFSYDRNQFVGLAILNRDATKKEPMHIKVAGKDYDLDVLEVC